MNLEFLYNFNYLQFEQSIHHNLSKILSCLGKPTMMDENYKGKIINLYRIIKCVVLPVNYNKLLIVSVKIKKNIQHELYKKLRM